MDGLSPAHLILILVIGLLVLGPGRLPEAGAALGRGSQGVPRRDERNRADATTTHGAPAAIERLSPPPIASGD
jgi:Sec-independent protein translocase protein TatA